MKMSNIIFGKPTKYERPLYLNNLTVPRNAHEAQKEENVATLDNDLSWCVWGPMLKIC